MPVRVRAKDRKGNKLAGLQTLRLGTYLDVDALQGFRFFESLHHQGVLDNFRIVSSSM